MKLAALIAAMAMGLTGCNGVKEVALLCQGVEKRMHIEASGGKIRNVTDEDAEVVHSVQIKARGDSLISVFIDGNLEYDSKDKEKNYPNSQFRNGIYTRTNGEYPHNEQYVVDTKSDMLTNNRSDQFQYENVLQTSTGEAHLVCQRKNE